MKQSIFLYVLVLACVLGGNWLTDAASLPTSIAGSVTNKAAKGTKELDAMDLTSAITSKAAEGTKKLGTGDLTSAVAAKKAFGVGAASKRRSFVSGRGVIIDRGVKMTDKQMDKPVQKTI